MEADRKYVRFSLRCIITLMMAAVFLISAVHADSVGFKASHDGYMNAVSTSAPWTTLESAKGSNAYNDQSEIRLTYLVSSSSKNNYTVNTRSMISFDTSKIPDNAVITNAVLCVKYLNKTIQLGGKREIALVAGTPANPAKYASTDYSRYSRTELAPRFNFSTISTGTMAFSIKSAQLGVINKTGTTTFTLLSGDDVDGAFSGTWKSGSMNYLAAYGASSSYSPILTVTYSTPVSSAATPSCPINLATMYNVKGDGTDEASKLQAAFNFARIQGACKVTFPKDKVIRIGSSINMSENLELDGQNATLKLTDGYTMVGENTAIYVRAHDWWHNLNYDGNNLRLGESVDYGVKIDDWVVIEESSFRNMTEYGLEGYHTSNWVFKNNHLENCTQYGIATGGATGISKNVTVTGNTILGMHQVGIKIRGTANSIISNNKIYITDRSYDGVSGIRLYSADNQNNHIIIENNVIESGSSGTDVGIFADIPSNNGSIIKNNVINFTHRGMFIKSDGLVITGNSIRNSRYTGIQMLSNNNTITQNTLENSGIIVGLSGYTPNNNIFKYNTIIGGNSYSLAAGDGIFLWYGGTNNNTFDSNSMKIDRYGFNINNTYGIVNKTRIVNNTITAGKACYLNQGSGTVISMNTCNGVYTK